MPTCPFRTLVVAMIAGLFMLGQPDMHAQSGRVSELRLEPIVFEAGPALGPGERAYVTVFGLPGADLHFLNARMFDPVTGEAVWVLRNVPITPWPDPYVFSVMFDATFLGPTYSVVPCEWVASPAWISDPAWVPEVEVELLAAPVTYSVPSGSDDVLPFSLPPFIPLPPIIWPPPDSIGLHYRGCNVPNIDLNNAVFYPPNVPVPNDKNACGPASAANSLEWLKGQHPELAGDTTDLRQKTDMLKQFMRMQKEDPNGVRFDSMVVGKLTLIDSLRLPIRVKYQTEHASGDTLLVSENPKFRHYAENHGALGMSPTFDFLRQEMDDGEDVEMHVGWYGNGVRDGGHWYVVTGYFQADSVRGVFVKDDIDQDAAEGTREQYFEWTLDANGYPYLKGLSGGTYGGHIESLVSESYDSTVTFVDVTMYDWSYRPIIYASADILDHTDDAFISFHPSCPPEMPDCVAFVNTAIHMPGEEPFWNIRNLPIWDATPAMAVTYRTDKNPAWSFSGLPDSITLLIAVGAFFTDVTPAVNDFTSVVTLFADTFHHFVPPAGIIGMHPPIPAYPGIFLPPVPPIFPFPQVYRGCEVPNVDLDTTQYPFVPATPETTDFAACGPAAAANSLEWLDDVHPEIMIPGDVRASLDTLKRLMRHNVAVDPDDPDPADFGVEYTDFIKGKLAFIDKYKLPIHVKYQAHSGPASIPSPDIRYGHSAANESDPAIGHPEYDWLAGEMEAGEDVEVMFGYYENPADTVEAGMEIPEGWVIADSIPATDSTDFMYILRDTTERVRSGGHFVNVTGYVDLGTSKWIVFKHDPDQDNPGGMIEEWSPWVSDTAHYAYILTHSRPYVRAYVETVVSESYDSTITFCPKRVTNTADAGDGSLRRAIECAMPGDTVDFHPILLGDTIMLTSGPLEILDDLTILANPGIVIVMADPVQLERVMEIAANAVVVVEGLHLAGGMGPDGAAIRNHGHLTLRDVVVDPGTGTTPASLVENLPGGQLQIQGATEIRKAD